MKHLFLKNHVKNNTFVTCEDSDTIHYINRVLRMEVGDTLRIYDNDSLNHISKITTLSPQLITFEIIKKAESTPISFQLHLAHAIIKSSAAMELIIQKAVELGACEIHLIKSKRTIPAYTPESWKNKKRRYEKIIENACNQCKRTTIPAVFYHDSLKLFLEKSSIPNRLFLEPTATDSIKTNFRKFKNETSLTLLIGPEGGWSEDEILLAIKQKCAPTNLGKLILRTETASLYALSICHYEFI